MSDLRYPVGTLEFTKDVTDALRAQWIQEIAKAPAHLRRGRWAERRAARHAVPA